MTFFRFGCMLKVESCFQAYHELEGIKIYLRMTNLGFDKPSLSSVWLTTLARIR